MKSDIIAQLDTEIRQLEKDLASLQKARSALVGPEPQLKAVAVPKPEKPAIVANGDEKRAPAHYLEQEMAKLVEANPGVTSKGMVNKLKAIKYPYSVSRLHVGKRLSKMVKLNELAVSLKGNERHYRIKK